MYQVDSIRLFSNGDDSDYSSTTIDYRLFTSKWLPMIPYFQLLTVAGLLTTLFETHTNVIKSLGKVRESLF